LGWKTFWEEETTVVTVEVEDTTVGTMLGTTMDTTMVTMVEEVTKQEEVVVDVNVTITSHSKINMDKLMEVVRELMRQAGGGAILLGMDVVMLGSHRGSLTILGPTKLVGVMARNRY